MEFQTMDRVHKPSDSDCYSPSWEPLDFANISAISEYTIANNLISYIFLLSI
jgi:hypothetical protein